MGRAPCCEKMGLKKGPWTPEEDKILVDYIRVNGHSNWRALPKHAGLLRCGKSCRLRWINYLRPDIKRGNFTQEEEETIIKLHEMLGNRWSAIAAKLPGRTDNEIKNVWHTHLKKRLPKQIEAETGSTTSPTAVVPTKKRARKSKSSVKIEAHEETESKVVSCMNDPGQDIVPNDNDNNNNNDENENDNVRPTDLTKCEPVSPQSCTSEVSTITSTSASENVNIRKENVGEKDGFIGEFTEINDDFWNEVLSVEDTAMSTEDLPSDLPCHMHISSADVLVTDPMCVSESNVHNEEMDFFWYNLLTRSDDLPEFSEMM